MKVRWSPEAGDDLVRIAEYIRAQNPEAALRVARRVYRAVAALRRDPRRGREGRVEGTRELVLAPLPYLVVYRVLKDAVEIARVLHGAQRWP